MKPNPKFYIVGGFVRDMLLGVKSKDIDFTVEASSYEEMKESIVSRGCDIKVEKPEFATIRAIDPKHGGVDFVLARRDGYYSDGRRPDAVLAGTLLDDLSRRDFTIGAMAIDEQSGEIIDYFGGKTDLQNRILRTVGQPIDRFSEDSLRILRALRFILTKSLQPHHSLDHALLQKRVVDKLENVSIERLREELHKMFVFNTWDALVLLNNYSLIRSIIQHKFGNLWLKPSLEKR